ncbi:protein SCO1 homolog 2, mitochondrial isoform X2 [Andrographis paniculata]|uniref:protein SCO1 homolog 2, mitochondrial isoform X2 n=1 Tax=Andrographis paniculata TaxID=175694 RepID=UPI0021E923CA|nr:protein SCO1 homolog 2, mitochondrial isoform X2 [Andrographis paniculata]
MPLAEKLLIRRLIREGDFKKSKRRDRGEMPLTSRFVFLSKSRSEASIRNIRGFLPYRWLSSSVLTRSTQNNVSHPLAVQEKMGNCKFHRFEKYYTSDTRSSSNRKPPFPLPDQDVPLNTWKAFLIPGTVLAGIGGLVLYMHHNDERRAIPKGKGEKLRSTTDGPIIGGPFSLIDTQGRLVTEKSLLGNWVLLYFGYTFSPDIGPEAVRKLANTHSILAKQQIRILPIFVTIDPQRDTPKHLHAYLEEFDSSIVGLTGPIAAIRPMAQEYRVFFKKIDDEGHDYLVESSHNMYLVNPNMEVVRSFGVNYSAEELAEEITKEIKKTKASK